MKEKFLEQTMGEYDEIKNAFKYIKKAYEKDELNLSLILAVTDMKNAINKISNIIDNCVITSV